MNAVMVGVVVAGTVAVVVMTVMFLPLWWTPARGRHRRQRWWY